GIGSDRTIYELKARKTINTDAERLYMVKALKPVKDAWINQGGGVLDFVDELRALKPDIYFVNSDGHTPEKEKLCRELGIEYVVSKRVPHGNLPARSTTALRKECLIPYRLDLAGGWLDQPYVSKYADGAVITISIEPDYEFNDRSGMSTSSRKKAIELWQTDIPDGNRDKLAKMLFCYENPPGTDYVSGSQDSLGIVMPALNKLFYTGDYWPSSIESITCENTLQWLEQRIWMIPLYPRKHNYNVLADTKIDRAGALALSKATDDCWTAILEQDAARAGDAMRRSFDAQIAMFPNMAPEDVLNQIEIFRNRVLGWKISGAGGGGYLILFSETPIENSIQIRIRR
ncbi:MAG: cytidyltransferase, partial [Paludibacter sp.]|nr:cytidyltransferase [Paludibacter sp.]